MKLVLERAEVQKGFKLAVQEMRHYGYPTKQLIRYTEVLASFPGFPHVQTKTASNKKLGGPWERGY